MALEEVQEKFLQLLREIKTESDRTKFLKWIHLNWNIRFLTDDDNSSEKILKAISEEIRSIVPFNGILPSENINMPVCGPNADCKSQSTVHVDEFLYDDEDLDELVEEGQLSRHYCNDCNGRNIKLLTFISHSMSINRIKYVFKYLLPPLTHETILDVGSRFGGVLYGAFLYTASPKIVGIEINPELCKIQTDIVQKFNFSDRIQIICNSIIKEIEMLSSADVIILNNIFEFFADVEETVSSWHFLAQNIKVGCLLVTIPHLDATFQHVEVGFDWEEWVEELEPFQADNYNCNDENFQSHEENVKHYRVKKKLNLFKK